MSEHLKNHETHESSQDSVDSAHEHAHKPEIDHAELEKQQKDVAEISRQTVEEEAAPSRLLAVEKDEPRMAMDFASHQAIKKDSYKSLLSQAQQSLPAASRRLSKVIHQKNIEAISNISAQTVARPSGLLGGGIGALLGSLTLLYAAKHYGFSYNYAFFLVTFLVGFAAGLVIEMLLKLVKRRA